MSKVHTIFSGVRRLRRRAFTLIELLIVVAVIAILASIAVPNFLQAQTRAKTARAAADKRAVATALETYAMDAGSQYPAYGNPRDKALFAGEAIIFVPTRMTTPVKYLTALPPDAFPGNRTGLSRDYRDTYFYRHDYATEYLGKTQPEGHVREHLYELTGARLSVRWTLWSYGPDLKDNHGTVLYDATNGVISKGDLMRFGP